MGAWALTRAPGRSSAACALLLQVAAWQWQAALLTFLWQAALLNDCVGRRGSPFFFAFVEVNPRLRFPVAVCGVQLVDEKIGQGGRWSLGPWCRVCG